MCRPKAWLCHLHGFHHGDLPAFVNQFSLSYIDRDDGALHGRADGHRALRPSGAQDIMLDIMGQHHGGWSAVAALLAIGEDGQWISAVYLCSCSCTLGLGAVRSYRG